MSRVDELEPVFVEFIPSERDLEPGKLYISMTYTTTVHLCASGCGLKVVLPLAPAKWRLLYDGDSVSLSPSVGNWDYPCRSHYWIRGNHVVWAPQWSSKRIEQGKRDDQRDVDDYFADPKKSRGRLPGVWDRFFDREQ